MHTIRATPLLLFFATGCADEDIAPEPSTGETPAASISLAPWPRPDLELVSPGLEPRSLLRVPTTEAAPDATIRWNSTFRTSATRGAVTTDPAIIQQQRTLAIQHTPGSPATFDFQVTEASDRSSGGPVVDGGVAAALKGRTGRWTAGPACDVQSAGIDTSGAGPAESHLPGLLRSAVDLCPLLPSEPVGVGARWRTTEQRQGSQPVTTEWVLVHADDQQVAITFQTLAAEGEHAQLADGRVGLDRHHPVPLRFDASGRSTRERPDTERPGQTLLWTTSWEMHAERTLKP